MVKFREEDCVKIMQYLENSFRSNGFEKQEFPWKSKATATLVGVFGLVQFVELEPKFVEDWECFY